MKYLSIVFFIFTGSVFAKTDIIEKTDYLDLKKETASKCDVVRKDVYNYCVTHGFNSSEATNIANAALSECKKVS